MNNINVKTEYDLMPASQRTWEVRRKLVIVMYLSYLLATIGFWLMGTMMGIYNRDLAGPWMYLFVIFCIIGLVSLGCASWLYASIRNVAKARDKELDERQRIVRDRAYRYAYQIVAGALVLFLVFGIALTQGKAITSPLQSLAVFWGIIQLLWTLPTAIVAWTEREV